MGNPNSVHTTDYGLSRVYIQKGPVHVDRSIAEVLKGIPAAVEDATQDERAEYRIQDKREWITSILSVPVRHGNDIMGVVRAYTANKRRFTKSDTDFVEAVANLGAIALANAEAHELLKKDYQELRDFGVVL